jgi:hypothetical protein
VLATHRRLKLRCLHCRVAFRPKRSDAKYCQPLRKQAAHHGRKRDAKAASAAGVVEKRKADALRVIAQLEAHRFIASMLHDAGMMGRYRQEVAGSLALAAQRALWDLIGRRAGGWM